VSGRRARAAAERKAAAEQQSPPNKKPATKPSARPAKVSTVSGTKKSGLTKAAPATSGGGRRGLIRFLREVIAELGKVVWPGRRELIIYTSVVLVFMILMVAYVAGLDILFAQGVLAVFG
jgi:preprotein translocase subunit SecE